MAGRRRSVLDATGVGRLGVGHRGVLEVNRFGPRGRGTPSPRITAAADLRRLVTTGRSPVGLSPTPAGGPPPPVRRVCRVDPSPESWREPAAANTNRRESSCSATRVWPDRQMACVLLPLGFRPLDSLTRVWTANETRPRTELQSADRLTSEEAMTGGSSLRTPWTWSHARSPRARRPHPPHQR